MGRVVATNAVPEAQCLPDLLKKLDNKDPDKPEPVKLLTQQRQDLLLTALQKDSGLDCFKVCCLSCLKGCGFAVGVPSCLLPGAK